MLISYDFVDYQSISQLDQLKGREHPGLHPFISMPSLISFVTDSYVIV